MTRSSGGVLAAILVIALFAGTSRKPGDVVARVQSGSGEASAQSAGEATAASAPGGEPNGEDYQERRFRDAFQEATGVTLADAATAKRLGFMIATVPHPTGTHLALTSDRTLEVIQQAIQDSGYYFLRAVLPWDEREYPASSDFKMRLAEEEFNRSKNHVPGALIFRNSVQPQYLVVFVVAEKPTEGIDRAQFLGALTIAKTFTKENPKQLLILGPMFSGSLNSMADVLTSENSPASGFNKIVVASGTVTNKEEIQLFASSLRTHWRDELFQTFQFTDDDSMAALLRQVTNTWGYKPDELAIISEGQTVYGGGVRKKTGGGVRKGKETEVPKDPKDNDDVPLGLSFPRNISHLRTAYEQQQKAEAATTTEDRRITRSLLKTFLGESRENADSVPTYGNQTPVSQESVLLGLVQELQRHHTRLIVLAATDPLDMLFLVRYFRTQYPAAHIVTFGADALLVHETDDPRMRGVMTLATYSLSPSAEPQAYPRVFPSADTAATYNAAFALAGCLHTPGSGMCAFDGKTIDGLGLVQYGSAQFSSQSQTIEGYRPELKLDALGTDGFFPVATLSPGADAAKYPPLAKTAPSPQSAWTTARSLNTIIILLSGGFVTLLFMLHKGSIMSTWEAAVTVAPAPQDKIRERFTVALCGMVYLLFVMPLWVLANTGIVAHNYRSVAGALALAVVGGGGACFLLLRKKYSPTAPKLFLTVAGAVLIVGAVTLLWRGTSAAVLYRAARAGSGLSPLVPVVLLTVSLLWWCWYNLAGAALVDKRRPRLPDVQNDRQQRAWLSDELIGISETRQGRLLNALTLSRGQLAYIGIGVFLALAVIRIVTGTLRPIATLEPALFAYVIFALLAVCVGLMLYECARIVLVWSEAKKLLHSLDAQPFRGSFNSVHGFSWSLLWRIGTGCIHEANRLTARQLEALRVAEGSLPYNTSLWWRGTVEQLHGTYIGMMKRDLRLSTTARAQSSATPVSAATGAAAAAQPAPQPEVCTEDRLLELYATLHNDLAEVAAIFLSHQSPSAVVLADNVPQEAAAQPEKPADKAAYFVCLVYIKFILMVLLRIRTLAVSAAGMFVLIVLAMTAYPFEPRGMIRSAFMLLFLGLITVIGVVYGQMHRDATLSRITDTTIGALGRDFWVRIVSLVGLPLVTLLAYQFPSVGNFIFSWIEPAMKSLR